MARSSGELVCCRLPVLKSLTMPDILAPCPSWRLAGWVVVEEVLEPAVLMVW